MLTIVIMDWVLRKLERLTSTKAIYSIKALTRKPMAPNLCFKVMEKKEYDIQVRDYQFKTNSALY